MVEWFQRNWPLLPGIILYLFSLRYYDKKVWWWYSFGDKIKWQGVILTICAWILFIIGLEYKYH
jgi:hypothetical protein